MMNYILIPLVTAGLAVLLTPAAIRFARRHRIYDRPNCRKVHSRPIPRFGGAAVFLASLLGTAGAMILLRSSGPAAVLPLMGTGAVLFATGLWDDIRTLSAGRKFMIQLGAAACLCLLGGRIESCSVAAVTVIFSAWLSWGISLLWIVGLTNAVNFMDGLDGLLAGVSAITCCFLGMVCLVLGQAALAIYLLAIGGALMGFLLFNSNPARIFLGDCGSLFLGFTLAGASVHLVRRGDLNLYLMVAAAFLVPAIDTLVIMLVRYTERRSIFSPDQNHFHHRLLRFGYRHRQAVLTIYAITFAALLGGLVILSAGLWTGLLVGLGLLSGILLLFRRFGSFEVRRLIRELKQKVATGSQIRREESSYEAAELSFRKAGSLPLWWRASCAAAATLEIGRLTLSLHTDGGTVCLRTWRQNGYDERTQGAFSMKVPVYDPTGSRRYTLQVELPSGACNESAARKLTLFARLIDKYGQIEYPDTEPFRITRPSPAPEAAAGALREEVAIA